MMIRLFALLPLLIAWPAAGQEPLEFRAGVKAVHLDVFVSRDGAPVVGLNSDDFEVRDNGVRQEVEVVSGREVPPIHAVLVLDTSSSVAGEKLADLKTAARAFLSGLGGGDRATLATFAHRTRLAGPVEADPASLHSALRGTRAGGGTALFDAVYAALHLADTRPRRPMVVVFSDGEDGLSWLSSEKVEAAARQSDAVVFAIHARQAPIPSDGRTPPALARRTDPSTRFLRAVSRNSGGLLWDAQDGDLEAAFQRALAEIKSRYLLRYQPQGVDCGGWHQLRVRLKGRKGRVRARRGYAATCDPEETPAER